MCEKTKNNSNNNEHKTANKREQSLTFNLQSGKAKPYDLKNIVKETNTKTQK